MNNEAFIRKYAEILEHMHFIAPAFQPWFDLDTFWSYRIFLFLFCNKYLSKFNAITFLLSKDIFSL